MLRNEGLKRVRMRLITAVIFVFTLTCSGSFGMEDVVSSSGPGMTLIMILVLPFVWSVPLAFVSSELGSMVPEAGGLYRWIRRGMGEYWSFQAGWWWSLSLYVDSAVYVALALDYMQAKWGFGSRRASRHRHRHRGGVHLHQHPGPRAHRVVADDHPDRRHGPAARVHGVGHHRRVGEPLQPGARAGRELPHLAQPGPGDHDVDVLRVGVDVHACR